jgi:hypothetical protein
MLNKSLFLFYLSFCAVPVLAHQSAPDRCVQIGREIDQMMSAPDFLSVTGQPYNERQVDVFEKIVAYGVDAVPFVILRLDDFRPLATRWLPLPNRKAMLPTESRKQYSFESVNQYGPEKVVDALSAVLNHLTHQPDPNFIYNGAENDLVRQKSIGFWRDYLQNRFYVDHPKACRPGGQSD